MSWDVVISDAEMALARADAEALLTDTFTPYVPGDPSTNADDYEVPGFAAGDPVLGATTGPSAQSRDTNTRFVSIGGVDRPVIAGGLKISILSPLPAIGWEYVCTAVGLASDPALLGRRYRVVDVPLKSFATSRRLDVVDVTEVS